PDYMFFFFSSRRRHTRSYGDWSSDVCSSDLLTVAVYESPAFAVRVEIVSLAVAGTRVPAASIRGAGFAATGFFTGAFFSGAGFRSEERRVGKECRSGWA